MTPNKQITVKVIFEIKTNILIWSDHITLYNVVHSYKDILMEYFEVFRDTKISYLVILPYLKCCSV